MEVSITREERIQAEQSPEVAQLWADGPTAHAAIEALRPNWGVELCPDHQRRVRAWRAGSLAALEALDRVTVALDLLMLDLELWARDEGREFWTRHPKGAWNVPEHQRFEIAQRRRAGERCRDIARTYGIGECTVSLWGRVYA